MIYRWITLSALLIISLHAAYAAELRFKDAPDLTLPSISVGKQVYVSLRAALDSLPLSLAADSAAGLYVMYSTRHCVSVSALDSVDVQFADSTLYVNVQRVAEAVGCPTISKKKSTGIVLGCTRPDSTLRAGWNVDDRAPGFALQESGDSTIHLDSALHAASVVVVFLRSGEWDPFSRSLLKSLQSASDSLKAAGIRVLAVHGYEPRSAVKWKQELALEFPVLSDPFCGVMRAYNVFDIGRLARPSIFLIDRSGVIRLRRVFEDVNTRPDLAPLIDYITRLR